MKPEHWQRIEQIYYAALERDAEQRPAFLTEACGDDATLRQEVEGLLAANDSADDFLITPALELEAKNLAAEQATALLGVQIEQTLSHYKILKRIGAGGMGEVFLARDTILERRVALKLLPVKFTQDAERLQRFVREAKAASALNHPNIITIYEIGEIATSLGKTHFIATEFIEGETLRSWTVDEEKRLRQVLDIAIQVASALDAAHKAGIVHRDIKPENVMVRPDGVVKVLDFGLAKLTTHSAESVDSEAQTLTLAMTKPGMILGTLRYMSPEQARGRVLDARSDIFSLGVMLYELLTGEALFAGDTDADIIAAIIHKEAPPLAQSLSEAPQELERIVHKALAKDKELRYQDARDLQIDLQTLQQESELSARLARSGSVTRENVTAQTSSILAAPRFSLRHLLLGLPVLLLLAAAIWWFVAGRRTVVETPPPELLKTAELITWQSVPGEVYSIGAFSPMGDLVAFTSTQSGSANIWLKQDAEGDATASTNDEFVNENPIWSGDGKEIAFTSMRSGRRDIWRKPPFGGSPKLLKKLASDEGNIKLKYWSKNGATIYYQLRENLFALDVNSGQARQLTDFAASKLNISSIGISPNEQYISYISTSDAGSGSIWLRPVGEGAARQLATSFAEAGNAVWHPDNQRIFFSSKVDGIYQIFVTDIAGHQPLKITFGDKNCFVLDVSADGTKILYGSSKEESDIWGVNVAKADEFPVASDFNFELWPDIAPNNQTMAYQEVGNLSQGDKLFFSSILTKSIGAEGRSSLLVKEGFLPKWSPDGKRLAFLRLVNSAFSLCTVNFGGEEKALTSGGLPSVEYSVLPYQRSHTSNFDWSPDNSQLVYISRRSGQRNLWTVAADGSSDTAITDNTDASLSLYCPLWSGDGKRIAYSSKLNKAATGENPTYSVWVTDAQTRKSRVIFQANSFLRLIGWSQNDQELILLTLSKAPLISGQTAEVALIGVSARTDESRSIAVLPSTYFYNVHLSADRRTIAFTSHQDGKDNLWVIAATGGEAKKLTANNDPRFYFSSLAWSPDSRAIYFGKQVRHSQLWMITNFK